MRPYPPKLSKRISASSTPREWSRSRTVLAIIGGPLAFGNAVVRAERYALIKATRASASPHHKHFVGLRWGPLGGKDTSAVSPMRRPTTTYSHPNEDKKAG